MPGTKHHSDKWRRCVAAVDAAGNVDSPEAVCTSALGDDSYEAASSGISESDASRINAALKDAGYSCAIEADEGTPSGANGSLQRPVETKKWAPKISFKESARKATFTAAGGAGQMRRIGEAIEVCIISEGPGNSHDGHWYTGEAVESGVTVFDGAKAFMDHPSADEQETRPERSGRDIVGYYRRPRVVVESDGRKALFATFELAVPEDPTKESDIVKQTRGLIETAVRHAKEFGSAQPFCGISINADGEERPAEIDGQEYRAVTRFTAATSADLVTFPAARGRFVGDLAAVREATRSGRLKEARAMKKAIVKEAANKVASIVKKMATTEDAEARAKLAAEATGYMAGMQDAAAEGDLTIKHEDPDADGAAPTESDEAKKKAAEEARAKAAAEAKAAEEGAKKAAEEAEEDEEDEESDTEAEESAKGKAGDLREAAKSLRKAGDEKGATAVEAQAKALETRGGQFAKKNSRIRSLEAENRYLRSVVSSRKLLSEAGVPENVLSESDLYGLSESEQRREIARTVRVVRAVESQVGERVTSLVEGAGPRIAAGASESGLDAIFAKHGITPKK